MAQPPPESGPDAVREREVVIEDEPRGPNVAGIIMAVVAAIVVLVLAFVLFDNLGPGGEGEPVDDGADEVEVDMPDDVDVDVDAGDSGDGDTGDGDAGDGGDTDAN